MPRRSTDSLKFVAPAFWRLDPPKELTAREAEQWRSIVATKPAEWFTRDMLQILVEYCEATSVSRSIAAEIKSFDPDWLKEAEGLARYDCLTRMKERQGRLLANLATKMRITQQSKYGARGAESHARTSAVAGKPWEQQKATAR